MEPKIIILYLDQKSFHSPHRPAPVSAGDASVPQSAADCVARPQSRHRRPLRPELRHLVVHRQLVQRPPCGGRWRVISILTHRVVHKNRLCQD